MEQRIHEIFNENFAEIPAFQLRAVDLPDAFEEAVEQAEIARQNIIKAQYEQQIAIIEAQTLIINAQAAMNITLIEANASAEAYMIQMQAQANALNITLSAQALSYYGLMQTLGLNTTELLTYLWIQAILEHDDSWLIISESTPTILLQPTP